MPYKDYNESMNVYMKNRYYKRRAQAISLLGNVCVACRSSDKLEFDHIDPSNKTFNIAKALSGWGWNRIVAELSKCQLLCATCHKAKTYGPLAQR